LIFADAAEDETVGKAVEVNGITNENLVSGLHTIVARATTQKAKYFLGYYINSDIYHRQLLRLMQGSKVSAISKGNLQKTDVSFPKDIEEQQKIGSYFKKLDDTIVLYQRKLEKIKALKTAYLSEMFPAEGETKPKRRFAGFTDDWEQRKLGDIANYRNGKAHEQVEDEDGKYTIINSKFISTNGKVQRYTNEQVEPIFDGEIAMVLSDLPNGKALAKLFLVKEDGKYTLNQRIAGITPNENIDPIFLNFRMNRNNYFLKFDSGVTQTNLSKSQVENFIALYPTFDEQYKIGLFFTQLDDTIALHQRKLQKLQNIKKAYLNEMFI
ncbi:restriction endonuclease subunit S, partial [Listeria monocytogenes]|nr:restriction endonuclease subunit S [Listeria monocytogenes]